MIGFNHLGNQIINHDENWGDVLFVKLITK
jgi:hypothetical protein